MTSYDPAHTFLAPFNLHKQVLGVIGLAVAPKSSKDGASGTSPSTAGPSDYTRLNHVPHALRNQHPGAVIHRVFAFDSGDAVSQEALEEGAEDAAMDLGSAEYLTDDVDLSGEGLRQANGTANGPSANGAGGDDYDPEDEEEKTKLKALQEQLARAPENGEAGRSGGGFGAQAAEGLVVIPAMRQDKKDVKFYLRQLIVDYVSTLLDGLDSVVAGLKGSPLETPRETLDIGISGVTNSYHAASTLGAQDGSSGGKATSPGWELGSRASALFSFGKDASSKPTGIGGGQQPDSLMSPPRGSGSSSSSNSSSSGGVNTLKKLTDTNRASKRIQSMGGSGPTGEGRHTKVLADYCLLAGDLWSAISYYDLAMKWMGKERCLAGGQDAVWFASALEGWAVTRALMARLGKSVEERVSLIIAM